MKWLCTIVVWLWSVSSAQATVLAGIDVLERQGFDILQGKRVGLLTNHTGRSCDGRSTIDILHGAPGVTLAALFSPEHGIRGEADEKLASGIDRRTGLKLHSLYGSSCTPTADMLRGIDVLVFDIQDIGTRFYTYIGTLSLAMQAARHAGIPFVVLDRPNPIGGDVVAGAIPVSQPAEGKNGCGALTSIHPIPTRHGMTVGELARLFNAEFGIGCSLTVIPMQGWRRDMPFASTGFSWINPSPNMKSATAALLYPGFGILETTSLSVGRGTERPFEMYGAPWLDAQAVIRNLVARHIPGIRFSACRFVPTAPGHSYRGTVCNGVCVTEVDPRRLDPVTAGLHLVQAIYQSHPARFRAYQGFATEVGDRDTWELLTRKGKRPAEVAGRWEQGLARFRAMRAGYLLY